MAEVVITKGDDELIDLAFKQTDGVSPLNITGNLGIWFTAKHSSLDEAEDAVIAKTSNPAAGVTVTDAVNGLATVAITPVDTEDLEPCVLVWDCQIKDAGGKIRTAAKGLLRIVHDVTRSTG
jgi:hypothetical protein